VAEPVLYEVDRDRFVPTQYTAGPWSSDLQHAGPPSALLSRAIDGASEVEPGVTARITMDILRPVPIAPLKVAVRTLRPGRRIEQLEAVLRLAADDTELMRATAWRVLTSDLDVPLEGENPPPAPPSESEPVTLPWWDEEIAYHAALEWRLASGSVEKPGPACVWTRLKVPLVHGEPTTPFQHLLVMADAASGVSWVLDWKDYTFPNVDFSVHMQRPVKGVWLAMDAVTRPGDEGFGQTIAILHDTTGRVGHSTQTLVIAER
jgi:hypothetical protein